MLVKLPNTKHGLHVPDRLVPRTALAHWVALDGLAELERNERAAMRKRIEQDRARAEARVDRVVAARTALATARAAAEADRLSPALTDIVLGALARLVGDSAADRWRVLAAAHVAAGLDDIHPVEVQVPVGAVEATRRAVMSDVADAAVAARIRVVADPAQLAATCTIRCGSGAWRVDLAEWLTELRACVDETIAGLDAAAASPEATLSATGGAKAAARDEVTE